MVKTDSFVYILTEDGTINQCMIASFRNEQPIFIQYQPFGNKANIKKIFPYFTKLNLGGFQKKSFGLMLLYNNELYSITEDNFGLKEYLKSLMSDVEDFSVSPDCDRCTIIHRSTPTTESFDVANNQNISSDAAPGKQLLLSRKRILYIKSKGIIIKNTDVSDRRTIENDMEVRFAGIARWFRDTKQLERMTDKNSVDKFFIVPKAKDGQVIFFDQTPDSQIDNIEISEEISDCQISYPYAFITHGKSFDMINLIDRKFTQSMVFNNNFLPSSILPLMNGTFLLANKNVLYCGEYTSPVEQINKMVPSNTTNVNEMIRAIRMCLAFPENEPKIVDLECEWFYKAGIEYVKAGNYTKGFTFLRRNGKTADTILRLFPTLIPTEITSEKWRTNKKDLSLIGTDSSGVPQYSRPVCEEISSYIRDYFNSPRILDDETKKVLNSVLIKCTVVRGQIKELISLIEQKKPIFFESTSAFLKARKMSDPFKLLCRVHNHNQTAIDYFKELRDYNEVIGVVKSSPDFFVMAKNEFNDVRAQLGDEAAGLFCSPFLAEPQITANDGILSFFSHAGAPPQLEIKFLEFCIYERSFKKIELSKLLVRKYLTLLSGVKNRSVSEYVPITAESEPTRSRRRGLRKILKSCQAIEIDDEIPDCFLEEKLALVRPGGLDSSFEKIVRPGIDFNVVLAFCRKYLKKDREMTPTEVYTRLLRCLVAQGGDERIRANVVTLLNECAGEIDFVEAAAIIPGAVSLREIRPFLESVSVDRVNELRLLAVKNALLRDVLRRKRRQLQYLRGGSVRITRNTYCSYCGARFESQPFNVLPDNTILHLMCTAAKGEGEA